jgi:hypothetical protein
MRVPGRMGSVVIGLCGLWLAMAAVTGGAQNPNPAPQESYAAGQGFKIAGTVVNAVTGAALARVKVSIADTRARTRKIEMVTGEGGNFEFAQLPAGKYSLQGAKRGYITSSYEQHEQYSTAIVTGSEFPTEKLVLRLMPMAMIMGHVLDESGEPVRSAQVRLFLEDHSGGMGRVTGAGGAASDDRGYFDIGVLRPGTYFVSASAKPWYAVHPPSGQAAGDSAQRVSPALDVAYPTTYYGGATEAESAAPIELKGGERQQIDVRLSPVPALHLILRMPVDGPEEVNNFRMPILQKRVFDSAQFVEMGRMRPVSPGVFEVTGVPAGRYDVRMKSTDPEEADQFSEMDLVHDGQNLSATQGEALGKLKVTVKMPGEEPLPRQYAVGLRDSRQRIVAFQQGDASGQVSFDAVRPGKYAIVVVSPGKMYSVVKAISAVEEVAGHEVNITSGVGLEATAELAEGKVGIEGVVQKNRKPIAGVMVALVPNDPEAHVELFRRDQSDFDGTFFLRGVIPGTYTIVAVEDAWGFDWLKAGVLARYAQHGQNVIIGELMRGTVHLPDAVEVQPR